MRVQYISDLHIEFLSEDEMWHLLAQIQPESDICVLAGDVGNPLKTDGLYVRFLIEMGRKFRKVFVIAGNNEFYGNNVELARATMRDVCAALPNVSFLDNTWEEFEGRRWIGTTLWSRVEEPRHTISDTARIPGMDAARYNALHAEARAFLAEALLAAEAEAVPAVVITHHLPLHELTAPQFRTPAVEKLRQWFSSDLGELVARFAPSIRGWIYGHTHARSQQTVLGVAFLCNPVGYVGENDRTYATMNAACDV